MDGLINVYKEKGYTSHDVTAIIRRLLRGERVGHAGTLDPEAEGVLIVLIGKGTKLSDYIMDGEKEYRATVKFGASTSTYDHTGEILETHKVDFNEDSLKNAVLEFIGEQEQIPPMYSAIKMNGKKLYNLARKGVTVERPARKIFISDIYVERFNGSDEADIYIKCGKGTYIRSICHDLGQKLGCGAYMSALIRTKAGRFKSDDGIKLSGLTALCEADGKQGVCKVLITLEEALQSYNKITAGPESGKLLYNGAKIGRELLTASVRIESLNVMYDWLGNLIGIYEAVNDKNGAFALKPKTMLYRHEGVHEFK